MFRFEAVAFFVFVAVECAKAASVAGPSTCTEEYKGFTTDKHTMCLEDKAGAKKVTLTQGVKDDILNRHNTIRGEVSPTATDMQKMVWDERLARVAEKWALQCEKGHDKNRSQPGLPGYIGQNVGWGYSTYMNAVKGWYDEIKDWTKDVWTEGTAHYIQIVFNAASHVGCGQANCNGVQFYVCNYFLGTITDVPQYTEGKSCAACPNKCSANLCDCQGKVCQNGGTLNLDTCQCECPPLWTGDTCDTMKCPRVDFQDWCSYSTTPALCPTHNYYTENCPIACGLCEDPCKDFTCEHGGTVVVGEKACSCKCPKNYSGDRCETCPPSDVYWCESVADKCNVWSNMKWDCSRFCGFCKE